MIDDPAQGSTPEPTGTEPGPDYSQGSPEDESTDAPTGKEATTGADAELEGDQAALQTDSS